MAMPFEELRNFISTNFNVRSTLFWLHQKRMLRRYAGLFDTIEVFPLTELQRRAVILNERRNLVVAGAGTGKTSVIVAKVGYLIRSGYCKPEEILLLAFNRNARDELAQRCKERLGVEFQAETFHSVGNLVLKHVEVKAPKLSVFATDERKLGAFINELIDELRGSNDPPLLTGPVSMLVHDGFCGQAGWPA